MNPSDPNHSLPRDPAQAAARARRAFIVRYGVLGWGLGTALVWTLGMKLWMPSAPLVGIALPALVLFPLGGWAWGVIVWRRQRGARVGRAPRD